MCEKEKKYSFFSETFSVLGLKDGRSIQLNELMKLNEYQRSMSFSDLGLNEVK